MYPAKPNYILCLTKRSYKAHKLESNIVALYIGDADNSEY